MGHQVLVVSSRVAPTQETTEVVTIAEGMRGFVEIVPVEDVVDSEEVVEDAVDMVVVEAEAVEVDAVERILTWEN